MLRRLIESVSHALLNSDRDRALVRLLAVAVRVYPRDALLRLQFGAALAQVDPVRAKRVLLAGAAMASHDARLLVYAANQLFFLGALDSSRALVEAAAAMHSDDNLVTDEIVFLRGMLALQDGDAELAERLLWEAVHRDPTDSTYLSGLLRCLVDLGRADEAKSVADSRIGMLSRPELLADVGL